MCKFSPFGQFWLADTNMELASHPMWRIPASANVEIFLIIFWYFLKFFICLFLFFLFFSSFSFFFPSSFAGCWTSTTNQRYGQARLLARLTLTHDGEGWGPARPNLTHDGKACPRPWWREQASPWLGEGKPYRRGRGSASLPASCKGRRERKKKRQKRKEI